MTQEIVPGVFLVGGAEHSDPSDCLCYGLDLGAPVLIDCGCGPGWSRIRANLDAAGLPAERLQNLVLTHSHVDHIGAATQVVAASGCEVVAHELDADAIETGDEKRTASDWYGIRLEPMTVDTRVADHTHTLSFPKGELHLLHTPGHTPGSLVAWLDTDEGRVLFGQDVHGPFHPAFGSDKAAWRDSMAELIELEADVLCEGHLGIYRGKETVRAFIEDQLTRHPA